MLLIVSLVFLSRSAGGEDDAAPAAPDTAEAIPLESWPDGMERQGISLERRHGWPQGASPRDVRFVRARQLHKRMERLGARGLAPELIEVISRLLAPSAAPDERTALVRAPDDCGQIELVADAARELARTGNDATLIILPAANEELVEQLRRWMPSATSTEVQVLRPGLERPDPGAALWIIDVQTLSDRFLGILSETRLAERIGLVVWWDVHRYTGVLAANVWAISRRLQRLLDAFARPAMRTLVLLRDASHADAQLTPFVRRLLPYRYVEGMVVRVEQGFARPVTLYELAGHAGRYRERPHDSMPEGIRHAVLTATEASAELRWPTSVRRPYMLTDSDVATTLGQSLDATTLVKDLIVSAPDAGARLMELADVEALSVASVLSQGGRTSAADLPHHVAVTTSGNPYVTYFLSQIGSRGVSYFGSRMLVGAKGHPSIIQRHLNEALKELPDTRSGLVRTFGWQQDVVQDMLAELDEEQLLVRREVRFLKADGERKIDYQYRSRKQVPQSKPLDTVGRALVAVKEAVAGGYGEDRMLVDPERLTIQAYPGRVFMHKGNRYTIPQWNEERVAQQQWIACSSEDRIVRTLREREPVLSRLALHPGAPVDVIFAGTQHTLRRLVLDLTYEESVFAAIRVELDPATGLGCVSPRTFSTPLLSKAFNTNAVALTFEPAPGPVVISTLCVALTCMLPVVLGIDADALEVVRLDGRYARVAAGDKYGPMETNLNGVAIVDLYPRGIGLVDVFQDDPAFLRHLLTLLRDWIGDDARLEGTPIARAMRAQIDLRATHELLTAVLEAPSSP